MPEKYGCFLSKGGFSRADKTGTIAELIGRVIDSGTTSVTVEVKMFGEDLLSGERHLAAEGKFVLVAINKKGSPSPISAS